MNGGLSALSSITYHANGMSNVIAHRTNQLVETIAQAPNGMARPLSISMTSPSVTPPNSFTTGTYSYDGAGNIKAMGSDSFKYDRYQRLVEAQMGSLSPSQSQTTTFDIYGNITAMNTNGTGENFPSSGTTNRLNSASYDAAGNTTGWNGNVYAWDLFNRMTHWGNGSEGWSYVYSADDERLWSIKDVANATYTNWTIRGFGNQVLTRDERRPPSPLVDPYEAPSSLCPTAPPGTNIFCDNFETGDTSAWGSTGTAGGRAVTDYVYRDGKLFATYDQDGDYKDVGLDHLGTIRAITNIFGEIGATHTYFPFGREATSPNQDTEVMKFTGHERDLQSTPGATADDLDYMHARFRSPLTGRFLSTDPAGGSPGAPQSWNLYAYSRNSPLLRLDSNGRTDRTFFEEFARDPALQARVLNAPYSPDRNRIAAIALGPMMVAFTAPALAAIAPEGAAATTLASALSGSVQGALNNEANPLAGMLTGEFAGAAANVFIPGKQIGSAFKSMAEGAIVDAVTGGSTGGAELGMTGAFSSLSRSILGSFSLLGKTLSNGTAAAIDEGMKSLGGLIGGGLDAVHAERNPATCNGGASSGASCQ